MKKREDIVQKFSTFLSFGGHKSATNPVWQSDLELERHIKILTQSDPEAKKEFWARHFLQILIAYSPEEPKKNQACLAPDSYSKAGRHLSAYLQEACLWAAQKTYQKFKFIRHKYPLEEHFQIANLAANPPLKLLKSFNFDHPNTNIECYAKIAIIRYISNTIFAHDLEAKRQKFSDYGLLKDLTNKELREALKSQGLKENVINLYWLAWKCFDENYRPNPRRGNRSLEPPKAEHLQQIATSYNQRCNQLDLSATAVSGDRIQQMLSACIQATRDYRTNRFLPLEDYDNICDPIPNQWQTLVQEEEWQVVQSLVWQLFLTMPLSIQIILKLQQGLNLTQTEIAMILQNQYPELQKQYQVARQLARYNKILLKDFAKEWNKINPEILIDDDKDIERIKDALNECLQFSCAKLLSHILEKLLKEFTLEEKRLLFAHSLNVKTKFIKLAQNEIENHMQLENSSLDGVHDKFIYFINEWLRSKTFILKHGDERK